MKKPKINFFRFLLVELRCFLFDWEAIVFICTIISSFILFTKGNCLSELEKVLYGGIVSGFVFYFLIEFLPRTANKRKNLIRLAIEMKKCFEYIDSVFLDIKEEFKDKKIDIKEEQRFFKVLKLQNRKYNPTSTNLRLVKCTTNTNPINLIYCNLGESLENKYLRLKEKIIHLDKVASTIQLESIDFDSLIEINQIADQKAFYKNIPIILPHTNNDNDNNAAVFGTDFDIIFDKLSIVRNRLQTRFNLSIN